MNRSAMKVGMALRALGSAKREYLDKLPLDQEDTGCYIHLLEAAEFNLTNALEVLENEQRIKNLHG